MQQKVWRTLEVLAYILLIAGVAGDHISTMIGLRQPPLVIGDYTITIYEANEHVVRFMEQGLWLFIDVSLIIMGIVIPYLLIRLVNNPVVLVTLSYPFTLGILRLGACFWNVGIIHVYQQSLNITVGIG